MEGRETSKLMAMRRCCWDRTVLRTHVVEISSVRNSVKWTIRWTFQIVHPPNYPFNYSSETSKMTPDRAINDLGTIKYLLDATESPQRFLTDARISAFLYSLSPPILSVEFWTSEMFGTWNTAELIEDFVKEEESKQWCFLSLVFRVGVRMQQYLGDTDCILQPPDCPRKCFNIYIIYYKEVELTEEPCGVTGAMNKGLNITCTSTFRWF